MKNTRNVSVNDISVAILEDDTIDQIKIEMMLTKHLSSQYKYRLGGIYSKLDDLITYLNDHKVDLILSDIMIDNKPIGLELLKIFKDTQLPVVLMTSSQDPKLFLESQKYLSVHYLIKPFHAITLQSTIEKTLEAHQKSKQYDFLDKKYLYLSSKAGHKDQVWFAEIMYIEADDSHCYIHTSAKKYVLKKSLSKLLEEDLNDQFIRIHHKYAVNRIHIQHSKADTVQLTEPIVLPVGKSFRKELKGFIKKHT